MTKLERELVAALKRIVKANERWWKAYLKDGEVMMEQQHQDSMISDAAKLLERLAALKGEK